MPNNNVNPEVQAEQQPTQLTADPMSSLMVLIMNALRSSSPTLFSPPSGLQSPYGGPGQMSIPQRQPEQNIWSLGMNIPNWLMGTNYPTKLPAGYHHPEIGQTWEDVQRNQNSYRQFSEYTYQAGASGRDHVFRSIDSLSNLAGFRNVLRDEQGNLTKMGENLSSRAFSPYVNQLSAYMGGYNMDSMSGIWQQRGQLGYNIARSEGRQRGAAPVEDDNASATKLMDALKDVMFERDTRNGGYNMFTRKMENMYGFNPDQITKMAQIAVQGGATLQKPSDITSMLAKASSVAAFTGGDEEGVQNAVNLMAKQGLFQMDSGKAENVTASLRAMAKNLRELNNTQDQIRDVMEQGDKLATALGSGTSSILRDPKTGQPATLGYQASSMAVSGMVLSRMGQDTRLLQEGLVKAGLAGRELRPDEQTQMNQASMAAVQSSEFYGLGRALALREDPEGKMRMQEYMDIASRGDIKEAERFLRGQEVAMGTGSGGFKPGSTYMNVMSPRWQAFSDTDAGMKMEAELLGAGARVLTGESAKDVAMSRYLRTVGKMESLVMSGAPIDRPDTTKEGLNGVIAQLREEGRGQEARDLETLMLKPGGVQAANKLYGRIYQRESGMVAAYANAASAAAEKAIGETMSPRNQRNWIVTKERAAMQDALDQPEGWASETERLEWKRKIEESKANGNFNEVLDEFMEGTPQGRSLRVGIEQEAKRNAAQYGPVDEETTQRTANADLAKSVIARMEAAQGVTLKGLDALSLATSARVLGGKGSPSISPAMDRATANAIGNAADPAEVMRQIGDERTSMELEKAFRAKLSETSAYNQTMRLMFDWSPATMGAMTGNWTDIADSENTSVLDKEVPGAPSKPKAKQSPLRQAMGKIYEGVAGFFRPAEEETGYVKGGGPLSPEVLAKKARESSASGASAAAGAGTTTVHVVLGKNLEFANDLVALGGSVTTRGKDMYVRRA